MIKVTKHQTASKAHVCDECGHKIEEGQRYARTAQFESWEDLGYEAEPVFSEVSDPYVQQQVWKRIMRNSQQVLILKTHEKESQCVPSEG